MGSTCLTEDAIAAWLDGGLRPDAVVLMEAHVDCCDRCRKLLAGAARRSSEPAFATTAHGAPEKAKEDAAPWTPPEWLEEYRYVRRIGAGGMGHVHLYEDTRLHRKVAVKFLHRLGEAQRRRFAQEAVALARLAHPAVVAVYRAGEAGGIPYLVSEYIEGESLQGVGAPMGPTDIVEIAQQLAAGLEHAHAAGVLHRDIKPANVIRTRDGRVKLVDFGLAKLDAVDDGDSSQCTEHPSEAVLAELTGAEARLGTPLYMSPEQWRGEPATAASDIYGLGAMLYYLASGTPPHPGSGGLALLGQRVLQVEAPPLRYAAPQFDARLGAVIDRCLRRDPEQRFSSMRAFVDALRASQQRRGLSRRAWLAMGAAALLLLLFGTAVVATRGPVVRGGVALAGAFYELPWTWGPYQRLCRSLAEGAEGCPIDALLMARAPRRSSVGLTVWLRRGGRARLIAQSRLLFAFDEIALAPSASESAMKYQAWALQELAELSADGPPPARGRMAARPPFVQPEQIGEDVMLLAALVRWQRDGVVPPDEEIVRGDVELQEIQRRVQRCEQDAQPWPCALAAFLYVMRCPVCVETAAAQRILEFNAPPERTLGQLWRLQWARQLCEHQRPVDAARLIQPFRERAVENICWQIRLLGTAACIASHRLALPRDQAWLMRLAEANSTDLQQCDTESLGVALGDRGEWRLRAGRYTDAELDSRRAYELERHPAHLMDTAIAMLAQRTPAPDILDLLLPGVLDSLREARWRMAGRLLRWAASRSVTDARILVALYAVTPNQHAGLHGGPQYEAFFCSDENSQNCIIYRILTTPRLPDSSRRLALMLRVEDEPTAASGAAP